MTEDGPQLVQTRLREPVDDTTRSLLRMLYVTEVYSAETFARMLETYRGLSGDQRRKLEACRRLELAMSRRLHDHLTRDLGLPVRTPPRARQAAETLASLPHGAWSERMTELEGGSIRGVTGFRTLKALYGEREPNLCATLLAHEMALRDFARDELDGQPDCSLDRILKLLGAEDRRAVAALDPADTVQADRVQSETASATAHPSMR